MLGAALLAGLLPLIASAPSAVIPAQSHSRPVARASISSQFDNFQIPAGTALLLELKTPFDSASAKIDDEIEAALWSPVIQNGVELIPAESIVSGKITGVVRASKETPIGSVTFMLTVVQHRGTLDRAMLRTQRVVIEAPAEPVAPGKSRKQKPAEAAMTPGSRFVAVMSEPLIVRIPK